MPSPHILWNDKQYSGEEMHVHEMLQKKEKVPPRHTFPKTVSEEILKPWKWAPTLPLKRENRNKVIGKNLSTAEKQLQGTSDRNICVFCLSKKRRKTRYIGVTHVNDSCILNTEEMCVNFIETGIWSFKSYKLIINILFWL